MTIERLIQIYYDSCNRGVIIVGGVTVVSIDLIDQFIMYFRNESLCLLFRMSIVPKQTLYINQYLSLSKWFTKYKVIITIIVFFKGLSTFNQIYLYNRTDDTPSLILSSIWNINSFDSILFLLIHGLLIYVSSLGSFVHSSSSFLLSFLPFSDSSC